MANQKKKYVIQMEVTNETIKDFGINPKAVSYQKVGNETKLVHLIEVEDEEVYRAYMQPIWKEAKRKERQMNAIDESKKTAVSLDQLFEENQYEAADYHQESALQQIQKEELYLKLNEILKEFKGIDKQIIDYFMEDKTDIEIGKLTGLKRVTVNKKRHKIFSKLKDSLKDYR